MKQWKAIVRSAVGVGHQKQNLPCQDYGGYELITPDVIIGAVADGAGSAKYSDMGAKIAVDNSLRFFQELSKGRLHGGYHKPTLEQAKTQFVRLLDKVLSNIKKEAENLNCNYQELACTLLVFVSTPHWIIAMQIGDGFIAVRSDNGELQLLFNPDKGEYINETTFVTTSNALEDMQVKVLALESYFICASTDGLEKVAIQYKNCQPFTAFFSPLEEYLKETLLPEEDDQYIQDFLNSERLNTRTYDDKTLLLGLFYQ